MKDKLNRFRHASQEVFNFVIHAETNGSVEYVFEIDTVVRNTFVIYDGNGYSELHIEDALLNDELFFLALNGAFDGKDMRIEGETIVRDAETSKDHIAKLSIGIARLDFYQAANRAGEVVKPILVFRFPHKKPTGEHNLNFEIIR